MTLEPSSIIPIPGELTTCDGERLSMRRWPARGEPRGVALLLHAMMADGRTFERPVGLAADLSGAGWEVVVADFRGRGSGGVGGYDDLVCRDLPVMVEAAHTIAHGRPVVIVGHSLGGHVAAAAMGIGRVRADALVLVAANLWRADLEPSVAVWSVKSAGLHLLHGVASAWGRVPARSWGLGSSDESARYAQDLARYGRRGRWVSADGVWDYDAAVAHIDVPVLAVVGAGDRWLGRVDAAAAWASRVGRRPTELWVVGDGAYGVEGRPGHMGLLLDPDCAPWWNRLARWISRVAVP